MPVTCFFPRTAGGVAAGLGVGVTAGPGAEGSLSLLLFMTRLFAGNGAFLRVPGAYFLSNLAGTGGFAVFES